MRGFQQYPRGTRENCGTFSSIIPVTQNGTNFEVPKGGRGLESASKKSEGFRIADSDNRGSP